MASKILIAVCLVTTCLAQNPPSSPATPQVLVSEAKSRIKELSAEQLKALVDAKESFTLIDVREDHEWAAGHAAGAIHISRGMLEFLIESKVTRKDTKIVLYCQGGARSALAADALRRMGYTNVFSLAGGFAAYQKLGLPVER